MLNKRGGITVDVGGDGEGRPPDPSSQGDMRPTTSLMRAIVFPLALLFVLQSQARADKVDQLVKQMTSASDYKLRLSAALNLAKMNVRRPSVIRGFIRALGDSDKTVRGVSAASLGKLVDSSTPASLRTEVLDALRNARDHDSNSFVKRQAGKAYSQLENVGSGAPSAGGIFVDISGMGSKVDGPSKVPALMVKAAKGAFKKTAGSMMIEWPGGKSPGKAALSAKKMKAYHVSGTLTELRKTPRGSQTVVSCKVSMILATYPEKSMFGFAEGGAQVQASSTPREVNFAIEDCVSAVVESLVAKQIIPTIKIKAR